MRADAMSRSISQIGTISVCAIVIIIAVGGAYLGSAMSPSDVSSSLIMTAASSTLESNTSFPTPVHTTTVTISAKEPSVPEGCMNVAGGEGGGYTLDVYLPDQTSVKPGDLICLETVVANVSNESGSLIPFEQTINITDNAGNVVYRTDCLLSIPTAGNSSFSMGKLSSCTAFWQANMAGNGSAIEAGTYHVFVSVDFATSSANSPSHTFNLQVEADLELVPASGYTRTVVCYMGYTTMTESIIVNSAGSTSTVGSVTTPPPPANNTTLYIGYCNQTGP